MIETIITSVITALAGGFSGFIFARKKYNTEVDANKILNVEKSIDVYKELLNDTEKRIKLLIERCDAAEKRNDDLEKELKEVQNRMFTIMESICVNFTCALRKRDLTLFFNNHGDCTEKNP